MSTFNPEFIIEESKKEKKSHNLVLDIIKTSNDKQEMISKLKKIDNDYGKGGWENKEYMKKDVCNALISCCLGVPSGYAAAAATPLGLFGIPIGLLGLYLTGQVFHMRATKYDKFHYIEYYEKKMKGKKKVLETALKVEKDSKTREEIQARIKEADKCIKACDKEKRKLLPPKVAHAASEVDDLDDFDFDFDDEDWGDWEDIEIDEAVIQEAAKMKLYPVYQINTLSHTTVSKVIQAYTGDNYSHSLMALDPKLDKMYTYSMADHFGNEEFGLTKHGFKIESLDKYIELNPTTDIMVSCFFLKEKDYKKLQTVLYDYIENYEKTNYAFLDLIGIAMNKAKKGTNKYSMVCSTFVDSVLRMCDIDLIDDDPSLTTPGKLSRINNTKVYLLYTGKATKYNYKKVENTVKKLQRSSDLQPIKEAYLLEDYQRTWDAKFSEEGDLIISKKEKLNIEEEHAKSKKLYPIYKKNQNLEAMKFEADKLYYMNSILVHKLNGMNHKIMSKQREELITLRSKVMNEFTLYVRYISSKEPEYDFSNHYRNSPFCTAEMKITKGTLKWILNGIKMTLMNI